MVWADFLVGGVATWSISRLAPLGHRWMREQVSWRTERAVVIGDSPHVDDLVERLASECGSHSAVRRVSVKAIDINQALFSPNGRRSERIYIADPLSRAPSIKKLVDNLLPHGEALTFALAPLDLALYNCRLSKLGDIPLLTVGGGGFSPAARKVKRAIDIAGALILIALLSPVLIALSILLRLAYGSPVLFRQKRIGRGGEQFTLFKFRTMKRDAENMLTLNPELYREYVKNNYKLPLGDDTRITRLGRFLRASSLDELPQLFNVLRGEMSLVGPRPVVPEEVEKFGSFAPLILSVQPGLTGLWQVKGRSLIGDYDQRVRLNVEYIRDASIMRDLVILAKTLLVVLRIKEAGWERETAEVVKKSSAEKFAAARGMPTPPRAEQTQAASKHYDARKPRPISRLVWSSQSATRPQSKYQPRNDRSSE